MEMDGADGNCLEDAFRWVARCGEQYASMLLARKFRTEDHYVEVFVLGSYTNPYEYGAI